MRAIISLFILALLSACGGNIVKEQDKAPENRNIDISKVHDAVPKVEPRSRYGNPKSYDVFGKRYYVMNSAHGYVERGLASWYGTKFHGRRTSSGETYNMYAMTAAHKSLPLPAYVKVTNLENNRSIIVRVNDRGPFHEGRIIDLSYVAALKLDVVRTGTARVEVEAINPGSSRPIQEIAAVDKPKRPGPVKVKSRSTGFYIQASSFSVLSNAKRMQAQLSSISAHLVSVRQTIVNNKKWYRVLIGPISNAKIANNIVLKLERHGIHNPVFISQ